MQTKLHQMNQFIYDLNSNQYLTVENHSWILQSYNDIGAMFNKISTDYTDYRIPDFNNTNSVLSVLQRGLYGPYTLNNTKLNQIFKEHNLIVGNRLVELERVYNYTVKL
jgi:hypothetical protein